MGLPIIPNLGRVIGIIWDNWEISEKNILVPNCIISTKKDKRSHKISLLQFFFENYAFSKLLQSVPK
jgi:hypothetical protein